MNTLHFWWWCLRNGVNPIAVDVAIRGLAGRIAQSHVRDSRKFVVRLHGEAKADAIAKAKAHAEAQTAPKVTDSNAPQA